MALEVTIDAKVTIDGHPMRALSVTIGESLCEVSSALVEFTSHEQGSEPPEASAVIGKKAEVVFVQSDDGTERHYAGLIVEAERFEHEHIGRAAIRVRIAPHLWKLAHRADCRIFQEMSVPDIVKKVLQDGGVSDTEWKLSGSPSPRKYVAQYRETDLDFVSRLLFEEGIYFTVKHEAGKDTAVFGDDPTGLGDVPGSKTLAFEDVSGFNLSSAHVSKVRDLNQVRSDKVFTRDYFFEKPKLKLEANVEGKDPGGKSLEVYTYPGRFEKTGDAKLIAQVLLDSMQCERRMVEGYSGSISLLPGYRFEIEQHPYAPLNAEYLITEVELSWHDSHWGEEGAAAEAGAAFTLHFTAIPKKNAYRPPRREPARTCPGLQTAWTTGAAGKEIHVDKHARVKAKFHWDRTGPSDDKSSDWMRTSQLPLGGGVYLPRMGWEVSVAYLEGDVDRPYVMNRWYNGVNKPPYALPAGKARGSVQTATTPGGGTTNEFRMDDTKGSEEMFMNASYDMSIDVGNNKTESVGANETHEVGVGHKLNVTNSVSGNVGGNQTITVGAMQNWNVQTALNDDVTGSHTKKVGGLRNMKIGGDHRRTVTGNSTLNVSGVAIDLVVGAVSESTPASATHNVSAALIEATAGSRSIIVGGMRTENTTAAKIIVTKGGRGVQVKGMMMQMVGGAILSKIKGNRVEDAGATFTEIAAAAQMIKASAVTYEAKGLITVLMGGSILMITPANVMIIGAGVKFDMPAVETSGLILNN